MEQLKYALIGCGRIAANHIKAAVKNDLDIVALCDIDSNQIEKLISGSEILKNTIHTYTDYQEMLEKEELDLVAIATESGKHAKIAMDVIKKQKHVIIEKPITLSTADADEILKLQQEYKVKVAACHQNRFNESVQKIKETYKEGSFGKLYYGTISVRWNRNEEYYKQAIWRGTYEEDGGVLMNQCIHGIDLLLWLMDSEVVEVVGYTDNLAHSFIETEDIGIALIKFKNGTYGIIEGTSNVYGGNLEEDLYIFGSEGLVKASGMTANKIEYWKFSNNQETSIYQKKEEDKANNSIYGSGHILLYKDMIDAINHNKEPLVSSLEGKKAVEVILAIYKSSITGKKVQVPFGNISTLDIKAEQKK